MKRKYKGNREENGYLIALKDERKQNFDSGCRKTSECFDKKRIDRRG